MMKFLKGNHTALGEGWVDDRMTWRLDNTPRGEVTWRLDSTPRGEVREWVGLSNMETLKTDSICFCCVKTLGGFVLQLN